LDLNRSIYKKRAFVGYKPEDVHQTIQSIAEKHQNELGLLKREIQKQVDAIKQLRNEVKAENQVRIENPIEAELSKKLLEVYMQHTAEILEHKKELIKVEQYKKEQLIEKQEQLEVSKKRVNDVLHYLKAIPTQYLYETKGLSEQ
jgi:hypothetical protein